ncbi:unnamed protein product [Kuraishia capsulata CBS 1993]|uniref:Importin N-terminal domain-containing protein n=1 Tax=Kuraishia capsulata CBS 1993 TaxID=1382522 RepID=W6MHD1_9ASCO|nr:uncharacterized protein KUCA_T00001599001 [Kuraishia capsulata CBS 1993]CDK25629.1 unnamed protein product [Kuraishia capsulata CBS 1993]
MSEIELLGLIKSQSDSNNDTRKKAELSFIDLSRREPSMVMNSLISIGSQLQIDLPFRQAALLHLRRLVPQHWSLGFGSFIGPPVAQDAKTYIRSQLMELLGDLDSRIRNSAAYVIVQISAVDYPDEWPTLLDDLYTGVLSEGQKSVNLKLGSLSVLRDIFDDLVNEDQFFDGGVGPVVLQNCEQLLVNPETPLLVKIASLKLFATCVSQMENADIWSFPQRKALIEAFVPRALSFLRELLVPGKPENQLSSLLNISYLTEIFSVTCSIVNAFSSSQRELIDQLDQMFYDLILYYLEGVSSIYSSPNFQFPDLEEFQSNQTEYIEPKDVVRNMIMVVIPLIPLIFQEKRVSKVETLSAILQALSQITDDCIESWDEDFNEFVSKETEISIYKDVRDVVQIAVSEISGYSAMEMFKTLLTSFQNDAENNSLSWKTKEANLFLMSSCLLSDDDFPTTGPELSLEGLVAGFSSMLTASAGQVGGSMSDQLFFARLTCFIPRLFEQFKSESSEDLALSTVNSYLQASSFFDQNSMEIVKCSILIGFSYLLPYLPEEGLGRDHQLALMKLIELLLVDSEEDTRIMLLETLKNAIDIDNTSLDSKTIGLIYDISLKYASSFSITQNAIECIESVLHGSEEQQYLSLCDAGLSPLLKTFVDTINSTNGNIEYSPELVFALDILTIFMKEARLDASGQMPVPVFEQVFPIISKLTFETSDDQLLQSVSETYVQLLERSSRLIAQYSEGDGDSNGFEILLKIISKFLSPDLGDSAIANLGDLIIALIHQFQDQSAMGQFFEEILKAVTVRLIAAKNIVAIASLTLVFCDLAVNSTRQTIDFLSGFQVSVANAPKTALEVVMPMWFDSFEIVAGHAQIVKNIEAFTQILYLNDERLSNLIVNGDALPMQVDPNIIITRSMAKNYQTRYSQIPATVKMTKLLVQELKSQSESQNNVDDAIEGAMDPNKVAQAAENDDDGWEDLDDVGVPSFQKLQSFADDDEEKEHSAFSDQDTLELLKQFFKQFASKPEYNFETIYQYLSDEEKKSLTEYVFF